MSDRPLRFAVVIHTPKDPHSAVYISYQSLAATLERMHHTVTILGPGDFPSVARFDGRWTPLVYPLAVAAWLRKHADDFDLVMFHSYSGWLATALNRRRPPGLVMFHGIEPLYHRELQVETERGGGRLSWRYRALQELLMPMFLKIACRTAAGVTCLNRTEASYLNARGWAADGTVHVLTHGVPPEFCVPVRKLRPVRTLLFVGQWLPMKGIRYLHEAILALLTDDDQMRVVLAGTLAGAEQVQAEFSTTVRNRIQVLPRVNQPELARLYQEADIFVFPSLYEGFSRAILEAMAARLPIVCTTVGVAADALRHEHNALIVPKRDAHAIVAAVDRLKGDPLLAQRLADRAAESAGDYTLDAASERTIDVILNTARRTQ